VTGIEKKNVLGFIPNAIEVICKNKSYYFSSFAKRNAAYRLLYSVWKGVSFESQDGDVAEEDNEVPGTDCLQTEQAENDYNEINFLQTVSADNQQEMIKVVLPVNVEKYFSLCVSDEAVFSLLDHFKMKGESEVTLSKWIENPELGVHTREINMIIRTPENPFKSTSRCYKVQSYKKEEEKLLISTMTKTLDVPYGSCFQVEERWEVTPDVENKEKCMLRCLAWFVFNKSTYFKSKIETQGTISIKADYELYIKNIKEKKIFDNPNKAKLKENNIKQDFEKSNPLQLEVDDEDTSPNKASFDEKKEEKNKKKKSKELEGVSNEKIKDLERIMKINGIFLLILVMALFLLIIMVNMNMKSLSLQIKSLEEKIIQCGVNFTLIT